MHEASLSNPAVMHEDADPASRCCAGPVILAGIAAPFVAAARALGCSKLCGLYAARAALVRQLLLEHRYSVVFVVRVMVVTLQP